jgi:hypothetical protein
MPHATEHMQETLALCQQWMIHCSRHNMQCRTAHGAVGFSLHAVVRCQQSNDSVASLVTIR